MEMHSKAAALLTIVCMLSGTQAIRIGMKAEVIAKYSDTYDLVKNDTGTILVTVVDLTVVDLDDEQSEHATVTQKQTGGKRTQVDKKHLTPQRVFFMVQPDGPVDPSCAMPSGQCLLDKSGNKEDGEELYFFDIVSVNVSDLENASELGLELVYLESDKSFLRAKDLNNKKIFKKYDTKAEAHKVEDRILKERDEGRQNIEERANKAKDEAAAGREPEKVDHTKMLKEVIPPLPNVEEHKEDTTELGDAFRRQEATETTMQQQLDKLETKPGKTDQIITKKNVTQETLAGMDAQWDKPKPTEANQTDFRHEMKTFDDSLSVEERMKLQRKEADAKKSKKSPSKNDKKLYRMNKMALKFHLQKNGLTDPHLLAKKVKEIMEEKERRKERRIQRKIEKAAAKKAKEANNSGSGSENGPPTPPESPGL